MHLLDSSVLALSTPVGKYGVQVWENLSYLLEDSTSINLWLISRSWRGDRIFRLMKSKSPMNPCDHKERQKMQKYNWATKHSLTSCYHSMNDTKVVLPTIWWSCRSGIILMAYANYINGWCLYLMPSLTILQKSGFFLYPAMSCCAGWVWSRKYSCPHSHCSSCPGSPPGAYWMRSYI